MAHPKSRAERRNMKFKRTPAGRRVDVINGGEFGREPEESTVSPKLFKEHLKEREAEEELREVRAVYDRVDGSEASSTSGITDHLNLNEPKSGEGSVGTVPPM